MTAFDWTPIESARKSLPRSLRHLYLNYRCDAKIYPTFEPTIMDFGGAIFSEVSSLQEFKVLELEGRFDLEISSLGNLIRQNPNLEVLGLPMIELGSRRVNELGINLFGPRLRSLWISVKAGELAVLLDPGRNPVPLALEDFDVSFAPAPTTGDIRAINTLTSLVELRIYGERSFGARVLGEIAATVKCLTKLRKLAVGGGPLPLSWVDRIREITEDRCLVTGRIVTDAQRDEGLDDDDFDTDEENGFEEDGIEKQLIKQWHENPHLFFLSQVRGSRGSKSPPDV
jgi:hypothetical protein